MTALATLDLPDRPPRGIVKHTNLYYPGQPDPVGLPKGWSGNHQPIPPPDPRWYIVWIQPRPDLFPEERRAKRALHLVDCRGPAR